MGIFSSKEKQTSQLTDITRGLHHAASTTMSMLAQQYLMMLEQYFDKRKDGVYEPKTVNITLSEDKIVSVPLISLVYPKGIALEKMKVALSVKIDDAEIKRATDELDGSTVDRTSFKVIMAPKGKGGKRRDSDLVEIEMEFGAFAPPEGIMRTIDLFTNMVAPYKDGIQVNEIKKDEVASIKASIQAAMNNSEIMDLLNNYGYKPEHLNEGLDLCNRVRKIEENVSTMEEKIKIFKDKVDERFYSATYKIAQLAFKNNEDVYKSLQLSGIRNQTIQTWLFQSINFYSTLLKSEISLSVMLKYGYEKKRLEAEFAHINKIDAGLKRKDELEQSPELISLPDWANDFKEIAKIALRNNAKLYGKVFPDTRILKNADGIESRSDYFN